MNRLNTPELLQFSRKYRFPGGRLKRLQLEYRKGQPALVARMIVRRADGTPVKLKLRLEGVEEHRLQKRPNMPAGKVMEFRLAYLQGRIYLSFDSLGLSPGEVPGVHDFRASELFAAGDALLWEEVEAKKEAE